MAGVLFYKNVLIKKSIQIQVVADILTMRHFVLIRLRSL
jgi:hypothetical protein